MLRGTMALLLGALGASATVAADRAIVLPPVSTSSWEFATHTTTPRLRPQMGVGFWQRASGAKPGVGANYISTMEYQLPEAAPARIRSATFQFSGRPSQCAGAEPVVVDVYAYAGNGRGEVSDTQAGSRIAQLSADCASNPAFARPIDVTALVRQLSVPAGVRHVGFSVRKANNRQGPGLFNLAAGKLTVVVADQALAQSPLAAGPRSLPPTRAGQVVPPADTGIVIGMPQAVPAAPPEGPKGLLRALGQTVRDPTRAEAQRAAATGTGVTP